MTWTVSFRVRGASESIGTRVPKLAGEKHRLTLGEYPAVSLAEAREKAIEAKGLARSGSSPIPSSAVEPPSISTVWALYEKFKVEHLARNHRIDTSAGFVLERHLLPILGQRELSSIGRGDLIGILEEVRVPREVTLANSEGRKRKVSRGGPGAAADVRKWATVMFQFAVDDGLLSTNPFSGVRNRDKQNRRDRVLSMEELRAVWRAAGALSYPLGPFFQLLMLTGDRRGEWANAQAWWLDKNRTRLEIPGSDYKTGKSQVIPLSKQASVIVSGLPAQELGPFIFSSTGGTRPISGFSKAKAQLDRKVLEQEGLSLRPWVVHDLRRSMATHMERIGVAPHIIEVCLGHALKGVAGVYRHYAYLPEKTAALQKWADELTAGT